MKTTGSNHILQRLSTILAAAFAAVWFVACSSDVPGTPGGDDDGAGMVTFRVVTPKSSYSTIGSRATWEDSYIGETGIEFETALLANQLKVVITDPDCVRTVAVSNLYCIQTIDAGSAIIYEFLGMVKYEDIETVQELKTGKIHVIANCGVGTGLTDDPVFVLSGLPSTSFRAIPMWGVKAINNFDDLESSKRFDIGDIHLLRSMAKVEIINDGSEDNFIKQLKSVTVSSANSDGHLLPLDWTKVVSTMKIDRDTPRIPAVQTSSGPVSYQFADNAVEFYLPEILNSPTEEITLTLRYVTTEGDDWESKLYFRPYINGEPSGSPYHICRNHIYRYKVSMPSTTEIKVIADLKSYTSVELDPDFGM